MTILFTILHILVCGALIVIILLQAGKGAGMGAAFGGASNTLFGSTGRVTFLTKITIAAAVIFGFTSLGLSFLNVGDKDIMKGYTPPVSAASDLGFGQPPAGIGIQPGEAPSAGTDHPTAGAGLPDILTPPAPADPAAPAPSLDLDLDAESSAPAEPMSPAPEAPAAPAPGDPASSNPADPQ